MQARSFVLELIIFRRSQHVWQNGRAIENYLLPASAPVAMLVRDLECASVLTREVFLTLSANFFPVAAIGVSEKDPKDITSVVGPGWEKWLEYSADGIQRVASSSSSAGMLKDFAVLLLKTTVDIIPENRATLILEQLEPLHAEIRGIYSGPKMELDELKSKFKSAIGGYGPSCKCASDVQLWTL